ncbi:hypothetical protein OWR29_32655 [Actinoplanes sp. Pm04-4]|uniref:DUF7507 domain-containing protein n=1 Tax=Paractinoplanes pyxinae TaxID=2997416 RepID=A0ABT4B8J4_9ACTN|nr:hypothetical protein [Actinoplanes pyxinae]MCY1142771.1 hypothetical protein [Actinoplanes pyxinae]
MAGEAEGAGTLRNTSRLVSSGSIDPEPSNDSDTATVTADPAAPALHLEVTTAVVPASAAGAGAGDTITYGYRVTNTGNLEMTGLAVIGTRGGPGACGTTTLGPGTTTTCTAGSYVVTSADVTAGNPITDVATATAGNATTTGPVQYAQVTAGVPLAAAWPSLVVLVTPTVSAPSRQNAAAAGDTIDYRYTVVNNGNVAMEFLGLSDTLGGGVSCPATTLAIGDTMTCTSVSGYVVRQADLDAGGAVTDAATVTARPAGSPTPRSYGPFGADVKVAAPAPALTVRVTADPTGPVAAGDRIAYRYEITNRGNVTVDRLLVTDEMIATIACPVTALAVGAAVVCTSAGDYQVTQDDIDAGVLIINDVLVEGHGVTPGSPRTTAEHSARVPVVPADPALRVTITPSAPSRGLTLGDRITYAYTVRNTGNVTMSEVTVNDSRLGVATCPAAAVAPAVAMTCAGASAYVITQDDVDAGGTIASTARVLGRAPADPVSRAYDTATASLPLASAGGSLVLTVTPVVTPAAHTTAVEAGDQIGYSYRVRNTGRVTMRDITVDDDTLGPAACTAGTLAPGASTSCASPATYEVRQVDVDAGEAITTDAYVSGRLPGGAVVTFGPATAAVAVLAAAPSLTVNGVAKVSPVARQYAARAGDTIAYTFEVVNSGNRTATGIVVTAVRSGTARCPATTLAVRATMTCTGGAEVTVRQSDVDADGPLVESVSVNGFGPFTVAVPLQKATPALRIVAAATVTPPGHRSGVAAGDTVEVSYRLTNTGNVTLTAVTVPSATCPITALVPGAAATCPADASYPVRQTDVDKAKPLTFAATASATGAGRRLTFGPASVSVPPVALRPRMTAAQTATWADRDGNGVLSIRDDVVSTVRVTNTGNATLVNVRVDGIPAKVTCDPTRLAPGAQATCVSEPYHLTADDIARGHRTYEARVTGDVESRPRPAQAHAPSTVVIPADDPGGTPGHFPVTGPDAARLALAGAAVLTLGVALMLLLTYTPPPERTAVPLYRDHTGQWRPALTLRS